VATVAKDATGKHYIAIGTGCNGVNNDTINFRVSSKASYDGILAVTNNTTDSNRDTTCGTGNPASG